MVQAPLGTHRREQPRLLSAKHGGLALLLLPGGDPERRGNGLYDGPNEQVSGWTLGVNMQKKLWMVDFPTCWAPFGDARCGCWVSFQLTEVVLSFLPLSPFGAGLWLAFTWDWLDVSPWWLFAISSLLRTGPLAFFAVSYGFCSRPKTKHVFDRGCDGDMSCNSWESNEHENNYEAKQKNNIYI